MEISGDKYRLLESIFSWEEDLVFLASEPGYNPAIGQIHCNAKRKLAYQWLRELRLDFEALYHVGLLVLVRSDVDRPDLNRALRNLRLSFYTHLALVRLRLLWGVPAVAEIRQLSTAFEYLIAYDRIINEITPGQLFPQ